MFGRVLSHLFLLHSVIMPSPRRASRDGAAAVELALVLPFLLFLMAAGVDFARVYHCSQAVDRCAQTAAMYASNPDLANNSPYESVTDAALAGETLDPAPSIAFQEGTDAAGNLYVQATATCQFPLICRFGGMPSPMTLTRTVRARLTAAAVLERGE